MGDRKYSQRGYQDSGREERQARGDAPRPRREGPRGRGLGAPTSTRFRCRDCGEGIRDPSAVASGSRCPNCDAALHACVNCAHFDPAQANECREPISAPISSKTKGNDCGHFAPKLVAELGEAKAAPSDPKAAFEDLFKS